MNRTPKKNELRLVKSALFGVVKAANKGFSIGAGHGHQGVLMKLLTLTELGQTIRNVPDEKRSDNLNP